MISLQDGQCGKCKHFGEHHQATPQLTQIRIKNEAPEEFHGECGHPVHAKLHLIVTAASGCDGFEKAAAN